MGTLGRSLLMLCVAMSIATLSAQQKEELSDQEALSLLLTTYNRKSNDNVIYGLLQAKPASDQGDRRILSFTIQETKCLKSENQNPDQCEFKEGGLVRDCSGEISTEQNRPLVLLSCDSMTAQEVEAQAEDDQSPVHFPTRTGRGGLRDGRRGGRDGRRGGHPGGRGRGGQDVEKEPSAFFPARNRPFRRPWPFPFPGPFPRPQPFPFPRPFPGGPNIPGPNQPDFDYI